VDTVSADGEARYDARGLVELDEVVPRISEIDGERATLDAHKLTTRRINLELRWLLYEGDDMVALASEEMAIRAVIDHEIETYDPYEGKVMVWTR
jgi:hypothetical protein